MILNKRHHFIVCWHKVCATVLGNQNCATGVRQAYRLIPVPALYEAIQHAGGKGITCPQNIPHLNRKAWHFDLPAALAILCKMDGRASRATLLHEYSRPQ